MVELAVRQRVFTPYTLSAMNLPEPIADATDKAQDLYSETADKAKDLYGDAADKAKDATSKAKDLYSNAADKATDLYGNAAGKAKDLYGDTASSVKDASDKAVNTFTKLSTTQKVLGAAFLAAVLGYLIAPKKK